MDTGRRSHRDGSRWGAVAVAALVLLALIGQPAGAAPATPAATSTPSRSGVTQPTVREVRLTGIDGSVLAAAPKPSAQAEGGVQAQSAAVTLKPAVAAEVRIGDPANLVAVVADKPFDAGTAIQVRVKEAGRWAAWTRLAVDSEDGPDPGSAEARSARIGSDPLMTPGASIAQVRIDTPTGKLPQGTELSLVHAPKAASDPKGRVAAMSTTGAPAILTRAQWGADESWRGRDPLYTDEIRMGFVHHTASTSKYSRDETAAQLRAIYAYHTKSLGHSDIDYNFLVDRFGRLWEGRYGGMDRPVLGAHTAGFNDRTFGVSALGNFDRYSPKASDMAAIRTSIARLFAWKLGMYGVNPSDTVKMVSAGYIKKTRYPRGAVANLPAISSHRMTSYTACPGRYLQAQMPAIRTLASQFSRPALKAPVPAASQVTAGAGPLAISARATRALRWKAQFLSPCSSRSVRTYTGSISRAGTIKFSWDLRDGSGARVLPATYTIRMSGTEANGASVAAVSRAVTVRPVAGAAWGPCANASRVVGSSNAATSVLWGRIIAPRSRTVVLTGEPSGAAARAAGIAAAPLARSLGAPLLLTPTRKLAREVATDIASRRATQVIIVGGKGIVRSKVAADVAALGARVSRLSGSSDAATAAAVARRMGPLTQAVLVDPRDAPGHALAGAALAAARHVPVLFVSAKGVPAATRAALAGRTSVTAVVPSDVPRRSLSAGLDGVRLTRIGAIDSVPGSAVVAASFPGQPARVVLLPEAEGSWGSAPAAAAAGLPLLITPDRNLGAASATYLKGRSALRGVLTPVPAGSIGDGVVGAASRLLKGQPWAPPSARARAGVTATSKQRVKQAQATPARLRAGSTVKVAAGVTARYTDRVWRAAPDGLAFELQFKASGARSYRTVATGVTASGRATATARAVKSGYWRIKVGKRASTSDRVRVRH